MSSPFQPSRSIEATNQAMLLMGGLSAQSYRETGILRAGGIGPGELASSDGASSQAHSNAELTSKEHLWVSKTGPSQLTQTFFAAFTKPSGFGVLEVTESQAVFDQNTPAVSVPSVDVLQQDLVFSDIASGSVNLQPTGETAAQFSSAESPDLTAVFGLLDFLLNELQTEQQASGPNLDGTNQDEARRQLGDGLRSLGDEIGGSLRDLLGGRVQDQTNAAIDSLGLEPLSNVVAPLAEFDYYNDSAALLQSTFSTLGTVSIPRIGPLLDDPQGELARYFG